MDFLRDGIRSFWHARQREGWRTALRGLTLPLFEFHRAFLLSRTLHAPILVIESKMPVEFRALSLGDLDRFGDTVPPVRVGRFAKKMQKGQICIAALFEGRVVAFQWAVLTRSALTRETPFRLAPGEVYLWGAYCRPDFRSHGIISAMTVFVLQWLQDQGFERVFLMTNRSNIPAIKLSKKAGFQITGQVLWFRLVSTVFFHLSPAHGVEIL